MKNQFRPVNSEYENEKHISRKKKATTKKLVKRTLEDKQREYGLEDSSEMIEYDRFIK